MAAGGIPAAVKLGPGRLYFAPLGTTEPTTASAALPSAWRPVGYTENGTQIDINITAEDIMVAEEYEAIDNVMVSRTVTLTVEMAEARKRNLLLATGGGAAGTDDGTPFELAAPGSEVGVMLVWDSDLDTPTSSNRRILFRTAKSTGTISMQRRKAPQKSTIAATFNCVKPDTTNGAVRFFPNTSGQI